MLSLIFSRIFSQETSGLDFYLGTKQMSLRSRTNPHYNAPKRHCLASQTALYQDPKGKYNDISLASSNIMIQVALEDLHVDNLKHNRTRGLANDILKTDSSNMLSRLREITLWFSTESAAGKLVNRNSLHCPKYWCVCPNWGIFTLSLPDTMTTSLELLTLEGFDLIEYADTLGDLDRRLLRHSHRLEYVRESSYRLRKAQDVVKLLRVS
ncbi:uncharacterized protein BDR25DRAFT_356588 [Lindgomyces ingoldianus]|uniref:Uncharacterized protein n=1 Tax=Lindgomyces ingoldianus TaxID=673940 RepID=A0ACB6QT67_9PLEO|nr:uncharacterized protein BDR25DRAFT_356588 [Lindgomyces ingoldianus]KAF2469356.1 hypothetical protein BDR25DRAFT_356588 [Lindgomyces ingoldianus]